MHDDNDIYYLVPEELNAIESAAVISSIAS